MARKPVRRADAHRAHRRRTGLGCAARDFDWSRTTAIPKEMTRRFADEPLYVDLRWTRAEPQGLTLQHAKFRSAILDIAAPLHGRAKDELDGEDVRQHRRTRIVSVAAGALILVGAAVAGWQAYVATQARLAAERSEKEALEQRDEATRQRGIADDQRKIAGEQRDEAVAQKKVAEEQRAEADRQRDQARRQRDAALGALLRSEAERLESVEQLDAALCWRRVGALFPPPISTNLYCAPVSMPTDRLAIVPRLERSIFAVPAGTLQSSVVEPGTWQLN